MAKIKYTDNRDRGHTIEARNVGSLNPKAAIQIIHEIWDGKRNIIHTLDIPAEHVPAFIAAVT